MKKALGLADGSSWISAEWPNYLTKIMWIYVSFMFNYKAHKRQILLAVLQFTFIFIVLQSSVFRCEALQGSKKSPFFLIHSCASCLLPSGCSESEQSLLMQHWIQAPLCLTSTESGCIAVTMQLQCSLRLCCGCNVHICSKHMFAAHLNAVCFVSQPWPCPSRFPAFLMFPTVLCF